MGNIGNDLTPHQMRQQHVESLRTIHEQQKENEKLSTEVEQLRVQLAGCAVAAQGGTDPEQSQVAKKGDYGWSPAYQDVLELRRKYDELKFRMEGLEK